MGFSGDVLINKINRRMSWRTPQSLIRESRWVSAQVPWITATISFPYVCAPCLFLMIIRLRNSPVRLCWFRLDLFVDLAYPYMQAIFYLFLGKCMRVHVCLFVIIFVGKHTTACCSIFIHLLFRPCPIFFRLTWKITMQQIKLRCIFLYGSCCHI